MDSKNIRGVGLKVTAPRTKILHILANAGQRHLSAEEIYNILLQQNFDIGLATVYRVLMQFEAAALVIRHNFGDGAAVYELNQGAHHDHLVCLSCGLVEEFVDEIIEQRQEQIAKQNNFKMTDHSLYIFGQCKICCVG